MRWWMDKYDTHVKDDIINEIYIDKKKHFKVWSCCTQGKLATHQMKDL